MAEEESDGMTGGGALAGITVVELAGIGPAPFAGMMLADHGARVIRVERPDSAPDRTDILSRSREIVRVDLKSEAGATFVRSLVAEADGLIEGFRPGVMERLGLGPDELLCINPRLVYGRMTGWGQHGPLAKDAGHDINFIALSGTLNALGRAGDKPTPPINLVGDFGGGGMMLAFGMLAGLLSARRTGCGQVVDCAMVDGSSLLMSMMWGFRAKGIWSDARGTNYLDTGAPYYDSYETADGRYVAIGAIEPQFYERLLGVLGLGDDPRFLSRDLADAAQQREALADLFRQRTRDQWCAVFAGADACFAPVLSFEEAQRHPHNLDRSMFVTLDNVVQPAPAPRFSGTPAPRPSAPRNIQEDQ